MTNKLKPYLKQYLLLAYLIILIGLLLRLWNFQNLFYFAIDEEKAAFIIRGIVQATHFPSVGHPSSIGFRLGPLLYYLIAPFYKIFGPTPPVWGFLSVLASIGSMVLIFLIGEKVGKLTGIYALVLYAFSYLNILYDRRGWQVSFHSIIALAVLYSLIQLARGSKKHAYILTLALIFASHFEVATILFIPLSIISIFLLKIKIPKKTLVICVSLFIASQTPLLFFDLKHNFINSKYLINYFFRLEENTRISENIPLVGTRQVYLTHNLLPNTLARTLFPTSTKNLAIEYANCPQYLEFKHLQINPFAKLFTISIVVIFTYLALKNWQGQSDSKNIKKVILIYIILIASASSIYTYIFNGEMAEYYYLSFFAYFFISLAFLLEKLSKSRLFFLPFLLLIIFVFINTINLFSSQNPYGYTHKIKAINYSLSITKDKPFILNSFQTCWYSGGYRYLYTLAGRKPLRSYMDQYLSEYYKPDEKTLPTYEVTILSPELIGDNPAGYEDYREKIAKTAYKTAKFGAIEIYIGKISN